MDNMVDCIHNASEDDCFKCMKNHSALDCSYFCVDYENRIPNEDVRRLYADAILTYGKNMQIDVALEEMGELIQAIIKYRRHRGSKQLMNIWEEIADVQIMLDQLKIIYCGESKVEEQIKKKQERLRERLSNE